MKLIENMFDKIRPMFEKGGKLEKLEPLFEAQETFMFVKPDRTVKGAHIRDSMDSKRFMTIVIIALAPALLFGIYNVGFQSYRSVGEAASIVKCSLLGLRYVLPIIIVSYCAGGFWEVLFAVVRKHEINEGFLVTGLLVPMIVPPTIPLWQLAIGISFGVVIGKEVFGGTGMNIFNPALTTRAFLFFAYATKMAGDSVWIAPAQFTAEKAPQTIDGLSGATPLAVATEHSIATAEAIAAAVKTGGADAAAAIAEKATPVAQVISEFNAGELVYSWKQMFLGIIPGSIGETSALLCIVGAVVLIATGIGSWRVMLGVLGGALITSTLMNALAPSVGSLMAIPFKFHLVMGGFAFGTVFMATDPVSATHTKLGKYIYGAGIGIVVIIIRTVNLAYPEGMMLSILFMNAFASLIDYYVLQFHIKRRQKRAQAA